MFLTSDYKTFLTYTEFLIIPATYNTIPLYNSLSYMSLYIKFSGTSFSSSSTLWHVSHHEGKSLVYFPYTTYRATDERARVHVVFHFFPLHYIIEMLSLESFFRGHHKIDSSKAFFFFLLCIMCPLWNPPPTLHEHHISLLYTYIQYCTVIAVPTYMHVHTPNEHHHLHMSL